MKVYVISGGPSTGKSATISELKKRGYKVLEEAAREIANKRFNRKSIKEIDKKKFQDAIFELQKEQIESLNFNVFSDRGLGDTLAYYKINKLRIPKESWNYALKFRYAKIFVLDFLDFYEKDSLRQESEEEQKKIQEIIIETYKNLGYKVVVVPFMKIEERADFILSRLEPKQ